MFITALVSVDTRSVEGFSLHAAPWEGLEGDYAIATMPSVVWHTVYVHSVVVCMGVCVPEASVVPINHRWLLSFWKCWQLWRGDVDRVLAAVGFVKFNKPCVFWLIAVNLE